MSGSPRAGYSRSSPIRVPEGLEGNQTVFLEVDYTDRVFEGRADINNRMNATFEVILSPPPDFNVTNVTIPTTYLPGEIFSIHYVVENLGPGEPWESAWFDKVTCFAVGGSGETASRNIVVSSRTPVGAQYSRTVTMRLPDSMVGLVRCNVTANFFGHVRELLPPTGVNTMVSLNDCVVQARNVDLDAMNITVAVIGRQLRVAYTVGTTDVTPLDSWTDTLTLFGPGGIRRSWLSRSWHGGYVGPSNVYSHIVSAQLPLEEVFYGQPVEVILTAANSGNVVESNRVNNVIMSSSFLYPIIMPDLLLSILDAPTTGSNVTAGSLVRLRYRVTNRGTGRMASESVTNDQILLRDTFNSTIATLAFVTGQGLGSGSSYSRTVDIALPISCFGTVRLGVVVNSDSTILLHPPGPREAFVSLVCQPTPTPDLVPLSVLTTVAQPGLVEVSWTVANEGQTLPGQHIWHDVCSFATTNSLSDPSLRLYQLDSYSFSLPLVGGSNWSNTRFAAVPLTLPLGDYYVMCSIDSSGLIGESNEGNNVAFSPEIVTITAPSNESTPWLDAPIDLVVDMINGTLVVGRGRLSVDFTVRNAGSEATQAVQWYDSIVLSVDTTYDPAVDFLLFPSRRHAGALAVGQEYNVTDMTVEIPRALAGQFAYVFIVTDTGEAVADYNRTNNAIQITPSALNLTDIGRTDLFSNGLSVTSNPPETGTVADPIPMVLNGQIEIQACTNNSGASPAVGPWYVSPFSNPFYLAFAC